MEPYADNPPRTIIGIRASALIEIVLFFVLMFAIDFLFASGHRFYDVQPHPYWIIVLLIACQYGTAEGLVAALVATAALLLGNLPAHEAGQDLYQYLLSVLRNPILWLIGAVMLGELRIRHVRERERLKRELFDAEERENTINNSYTAVKTLKERLELRVAGQMRSTISTYHAARSMEQLNPQDVLRGLETLVTSVLNPEAFSIYRIGTNGLELALAHGWQEGENFTRRIDSSSALYRAIAGEQRVLCIANPEQEQVLASQGVLAGPLIDRASGELLGMLKVERLGFADLNFSSIESFQALCQWGGTSLSNSVKYQRAQEGTFVNPDHNLYTAGYFDRHLSYITALAKRVNFDVTMLGVRIADTTNMDTETQLTIGRALATAVDSTLRSVDTAFDYQPQTGEFSIVLPTTNRPGAEIVLDKIRRELAKQLRITGQQSDVTFSIQSLHEKRAA
jgi:hypothetical protein